MKKRKIKPVTVNFFLVLIVILVCFFLASVTSALISSGEKDLEAKIADSWIYGLGWIGLMFLIVVKWILIIYGVILLIFSGIAIIVYGPSRGRILAYRILMGITYFMIALAMLFLLRPYFNVDFLTVENILLYAILTGTEIILFLVLFFNILNTYSSRIYPASMLEQLPESAPISKQDFHSVNGIDSFKQNEE